MSLSLSFLTHKIEKNDSKYLIGLLGGLNKVTHVNNYSAWHKRAFYYLWVIINPCPPGLYTFLQCDRYLTLNLLVRHFTI